MMTKGQFIELVLDPGKASEYLPDEIGALVEQFPYCQPLRFLQLRCFAGRQSIQYPSALKITSAHAPDRSRLFHLINPPMETGVVHRSATLDESGPETADITVGSTDPQGLIETEAAGTDHFEAKEEVNHPPMHVISGSEDDNNRESPWTESPVIPLNGEHLSTTQRQEPATDAPRETDAQELLIQQLKELNLWPEDEEEAITGASGSPATTSMPGLQDFYPLSTGQDGMEETKDEALEFEYEKQGDPATESIPPLPTDYFSMPGTEGEGTVDLNDYDKDVSKEITRLEVSEHAPEKLTFSEWLKSLSKESQRVKDRMVQGGNTEESHTLSGNGNQEKKQSGTSDTEGRPQDHPKSKVIYSKDAVGNATRRPMPSSTDEITGSIHQILPSASEKTTDKKPLPDPMLVATDPPKTKLPTDQLIDKFITEEPRITPSKSTFYSPVNMARKSVLETEDLVTETLAGIFARQGNFQKAIQYYEKLSLKFPEKSRYFAGLIEELKKKLNS